MVALSRYEFCSKHDILNIEEEEHTQSTELAAGRAGHDRQRHLDGDLPLSLTSLQPLKVQYPEQHYTVPLRYSTDAITRPLSFSFNLRNTL